MNRRAQSRKLAIEMLQPRYALDGTCGGTPYQLLPVESFFIDAPPSLPDVSAEVYEQFLDQLAAEFPGIASDADDGNGSGFWQLLPEAREVLSQHQFPEFPYSESTENDEAIKKVLRDQEGASEESAAIKLFDQDGRRLYVSMTGKVLVDVKVDMAYTGLHLLDATDFNVQWQSGDVLTAWLDPAQAEKVRDTVGVLSIATARPMVAIAQHRGLVVTGTCYDAPPSVFPHVYDYPGEQPSAISLLPETFQTTTIIPEMPATPTYGPQLPTWWNDPPAILAPEGGDGAMTHPLPSPWIDPADFPPPVTLYPYDFIGPLLPGQYRIAPLFD